MIPNGGVATTWDGRAGPGGVGACVGADDGHLVAEPAPEMGRPLGMGLDGDDPRARGQEGGRDDTPAGAHVEHEVAPVHGGAGDEPGSPLRAELVPPPRAA